MSAKEKTKRAARLNVKLAPGVNEKRSRSVFSKTPGYVAAIQLFPDEPEEEMRSFYVVEVEPSEVEQAVEKLRGDPAVEYAEAPARRKLIR